MTKWLALFATVALLAVPLDAAAQQRRWPVSLEASTGVGAGWAAGEFLDRTDGPVMAMDATVAVRVRTTAGGGGYVAALSGSFQGAPRDAICIMPPDRSGCIPHFPDFSLLALLGGWESATTNLRLTTGPALLQDGHFEEVFGWQARWDGAAPVFARIGLMASLRGVLVPAYHGDPIALMGFGVGLRVR
jgi:hypothetical protein